MRSSGVAAYRLIILAILFGGTAGLPVHAQVPSKKDPAPTGATRLPSGAIIVIAKDPDAIDKPDAIYLSPEKFKELNDQIEALKKQVAADKALPPSSCELSGGLEKRGTQTVVRLKATFKFRTLSPRSVVFLGCQKAQPVDAKMDDGKLPMLAAGEKGLSVLVESKGDHTVNLDLELPVQPRGQKGSEIGFELGLPGAPLTTLTFLAPDAAKRVSVARREIAGPMTPAIEPPLDVKRLDIERLLPGTGGEALGSISYLALSWEDPGQPNAIAGARSTEADVQVTVGETDIQAEARLRLRGTAKEWRFLAPYNAEVTVGRAPALGAAPKPVEFPVDQAPDVVRPEPGKSDWRIRFREANSAELLVVIGTRTPRNRSNDPKVHTLWQAGPFAAQDVAKQEGTIRIRSLPQLRTTVVKPLRGDTQRVDVPDDPNGEAVYRYRSLPMGAKEQILAPLELDIRAAEGVVQTRVHHHLSLGEGGWRLRSDITVTPIRTEVENLDLEVPVPGVFEASTPKLVEGIVPLRDSGPQRRIIQVKLAAPQRSEFTLALEGYYPSPLGVQETTLVMPRLLNVFDRGGQVSSAIPEGFDLRGGAYQWENDKPGTRLHPLEPTVGADRTTTLSAGVSRTISHVELAWKPSRADLRVQTTTDITLDDRQGKAIQQLHYVFADHPVRKLRLHGSTTLTGLAVAPGSLESNGPGDWFVNLPTDTLKETTLTLTYSFPLSLSSDESARLAVPLLWLEGATSYESRVRFLRSREAASHLLPVLAPDGPWQELPIELLPTETTLLVARGSGSNLPLTVLLHDPESSSPSLPSVWIDRILIQAQSADGVQKYRARFHLQKWQARSFDLELPSNASDVEVRIKGLLRTDLREALADGDGARIIPVPLPVWRERDKLIVELKYNLLGTPTEGVAGWIMRCQPPRPRGKVATGAVRWQIAFPARSQPLSLGDAVVEERWTVRGGLAQSLPAYSTSDLDKWIVSGQEPGGGEVPSGWEMPDAGISARQTILAPLRIVVAPRMALFCVVSLVVLVAGVLISRLSNRSIGLVLAVATAGAVVVGLVWPQPASQILAAAQPGFALFAIVLGAQRFLHWRYRRRLARMPGFSRVQAESALSRSNGKQPGPAAPGSILSREGAGNPS